MKVYSRYNEIQNYLKEKNLKDIEIVDDPKISNYIVSGQFTEKDYHKDLEGIIIPYTGHNKIDLEAMRKHNLKLYITPIRTKYVAEKAIALMLALLGNLINYHNKMKQGDWSERNSDSRVAWVSVQNKKVGFFGYGRIGKLTHEMLKSFNCDFYTIDRRKKYDSIALVKDLGELVDVCDIIVISVPLNKETEGIFDSKYLSVMENKYLINVGRGKIVNQRDLYESLITGKLAGYASDVWYNYPSNDELTFPSDYPIHELNNVVISNHSGGFTINTNDEVNKEVIKHLIRLRDKDYSEALDLDDLI